MVNFTLLIALPISLTLQPWKYEILNMANIASRRLLVVSVESSYLVVARAVAASLSPMEQR